MPEPEQTGGSEKPGTKGPATRASELNTLPELTGGTVVFVSVIESASIVSVSARLVDVVQEWNASR